MVRAPDNKRRDAVLVTSRADHPAPAFQCRCRRLVAVPVKGESICPKCGRRLKWVDQTTSLRLTAAVRKAQT